MRTIRSTACLVFAWVFSTVYWGLLTVVVLLTFRTTSRVLFPWAARWWGILLLWTMGIKLEVQGKEHFLGRKPRVVILNHESALDILWVATFCPSGSVGIAKKEFIYIPVVNLLWWAARCFLIDRRNQEKALQTLDDVARVIREEECTTYIAPEGTRTPDGEIQQFKKGAFHLAMDAQVPIYPIVVQGAYELLPKTSCLPKPGLVKVRCLEPLDVAGWNLEELEEKIAEVRDLIVKTKAELEAEQEDGRHL